MKKTKYKKITLIALSIIATGVLGGNLVGNGDAVDNWENVQASTENLHSGKTCLKMGEQTVSTTKKLIPIDGQKQYKLSGWFKSAGTSTQVMLLGFVPYDVNKMRIYCPEINNVIGTETFLVESCKPEDTVLKIKDGSKWFPDDNQRGAYIAFDIDRDFKDLPNRNLSTRGIETIANKGSYWEVKLKNPCGRNFPANTAIREHADGNCYIYSAIIQNVNAEWKEYSGIVNQQVKAAGSATKYWWAGTKYVTVLIEHVGDKVIFHDIKLEKLK